MRKKKEEKKDKEEPQGLNYEDLLNQFSTSEDLSKNEKKEPDENIILSELLDGIESQDEKKEEEPKKDDDYESIDIGSLADLNLDDLSFNEPSGKNIEPSKDKFEINIDTDKDDSEIDYSSILDELGVEKPEEQTTDKEESAVSFDVTKDDKIDDIENLTNSYSKLIEDEGNNSSEEMTVQTGESSESLDEFFKSLPEETIEEKTKEPEITAELPVLTEQESLEEDILKGFSDSAFDEPAETEKTPEETVDDGPQPIKPFDTDSDIEEKLTTLEELNIEESVSMEQNEAEEVHEPVSTFSIGSLDTEESEEDFLKLDDNLTPKKDTGVLSGIADVKQEIPTEILMPGIEMDIGEQISAVTRAEIFLKQGKRKEAAEIFADIAKKKGVTPIVAKHLK
jgi:hypothetical protein